VYDAMAHHKIEAEIKEQNLDCEQIKTYRQQYAKLILLEFKTWLHEKQNQSLPKGPLVKAVHDQLVMMNSLLYMK
jgi:hypothetical protein